MLECAVCASAFCGSNFQRNRVSRGKKVVCSLECRARNGTNRRHGHTGKNKPDSPTYQSWRSMIMRCRNINLTRYGGRGITVCDRWATDFNAFLADMGERPPGTSLDRYPDYDGNYEPGNCRWGTIMEQNYNHSAIRWVTISGETVSIAEAAKRAGVVRNIIYRRVHKKGVTHQQAVDYFMERAINGP
jgi:hypothetical protein